MKLDIDPLSKTEMLKAMREAGWPGDMAVLTVDLAIHASSEAMNALGRVLLTAPNEPSQIQAAQIANGIMAVALEEMLQKAHEAATESGFFIEEDEGKRYVG